MFTWNFMYFSLCLLPLVPPGTTEKSLAPSSLISLPAREVLSGNFNSLHGGHLNDKKTIANPMDVSSARSENRANSFNVIFYLSSTNPVFSIFSLQRQIITLSQNKSNKMTIASSCYIRYKDMETRWAHHLNR